MPVLPIDIHPEGYEELEQARFWYESKAKGLGTQFLDEVDRAMNAIQQSPNTWPIYSEGIRRFLLHRFPFAVIYRFNEAKIQIIAVMHLRRKPEYWGNRAIPQIF